MTYKEIRKEYDESLNDDFFQKFFRTLSFQIKYIYSNNNTHTKTKIASEFYSYYYGNGKKFAAYLSSLNFPKEDEKLIEKTISFVLEHNSNFIIPYIDFAINRYPHFAYYLTGDEYKHYVLYSTFMNLISYKNLYVYNKDIYCNDYDMEILSSLDSCNNIFYDETDLSNRIKECCNLMIPEIIKKENYIKNLDLSIAINKEFECRQNLYEISHKYFPEIKTYGNERIF